MLNIIFTIEGSGSNYKYRYSTIKGSIHFNLDISDIEFVLEKSDCSDLCYLESMTILEFLKSLDSEGLEEFSYRCLIFNFKAPNNEIRDCNFKYKDGESEAFYSLEMIAPEIFSTNSTNEKYPFLTLDWDISIYINY